MKSTSRFLCLAVAALLLPRANGGEPDAPAIFQPVNLVAKELAPGELIPDVTLRDSRGDELHMSDFRGKTVAVTFFYSRCTAATFCPMVGRKFDAAQAMLTRMESGAKCRLLSISLDPERDTAAMLAAYAQGYQADPQRWTFATSNYEDIQKLGGAVGLEYKRVGDRIDHNLRTVIVDASGRIRRVFRGDEWTPQELVAELRAASRRFR